MAYLLWRKNLCGFCGKDYLLLKLWDGERKQNELLSALRSEDGDMTDLIDRNDACIKVDEAIRSFYGTDEENKSLFKLRAAVCNVLNEMPKAECITKSDAITAVGEAIADGRSWYKAIKELGNGKDNEAEEEGEE